MEGTDLTMCAGGGGGGVYCIISPIILKRKTLILKTRKNNATDSWIAWELALVT